ncbi:DUF4422 domain-containing protein [Ileibacterium valens]|uniref:DUF4422 domain-containing protein n=1 Tax=Ileibacterium valens TaxID=1862668 RepID=UPI00259BCB91|nr:DUF4422 domain-containing protein [Ileibacterium valens]
MNIKIIVAAHKKYPISAESIYLPVQVGAFQRESIGYQRDDEGENISHKNPNYCELTGLYWAWKNLPSDYLGLVHYRRYFGGSQKGKGMEKVLSDQEAAEILNTTDCILPKKQWYLIETIYSHYDHTHYAQDIQKTRKIIAEYYPEYLNAFDRHMEKRSSHMFNMFIMRRDLADQYCKFLFGILGKLESELDMEAYDPFQARVLGRIGEILLDVWIDTNQINYKEMPMIYLEKINWRKKIIAFLQAKFFHKKYKGSF